MRLQLVNSMINTETVFYLLINTSLVISCLVMSIVFLRLPIPLIEFLKSYRISLKVLALDYLFMAGVILALMLEENLYMGSFSFIIIFAASLQTQFFSHTIIILYNPESVSKRFVFIHLLPIIGFAILFGLFTSIWGNPHIDDVSVFYRQIFHPTLILRLLFVGYYFLQLIYFSLLIIKQEQRYRERLNNYFSTTPHARLFWLRFSYFMALTVGLIALVSCFFSSQISLFVFNSICVLFFIGFGVIYIQYPLNHFIAESPSKRIQSNIISFQWTKMKKRIIEEKLYLREDINIERLAKFLRIGRTKLSICINQEENMNFNSWINTLRIEYAKVLFLENYEYSILHVSEILGYSEQSNFCRQFKQITGKTATEWRKENVTVKQALIEIL